MTPVFQTDYRIPGGNCFQACVASIMELPLQEVPNFLKESDGGPWTQPQWNAVKEFAKQRDYEVCWLDPDIPDDVGNIEVLKQSGLHYVATGCSPRTDNGHCVVGAGGVTVHDPMANVGGCPLVSDPWLYIFFLPSSDPESQKNCVVKNL